MTETSSQPIVEISLTPGTPSKPGPSLRSRSESELDYSLEPGFFNEKDQPSSFVVLHEKPEHRIIILLKARGMSNKDIAARLGYTQPWLSQVLRQPWARARLLDEINTVGRDGINALLRGEVENSIFTLIEVRDTALKPADRTSAAKELLDRYLGKPTQKVEAVSGPSTPADLEAADRELEELKREEARLTGGAAATTTNAPP